MLEQMEVIEKETLVVVALGKPPSLASLDGEMPACCALMEVEEAMRPDGSSLMPKM